MIWNISGCSIIMNFLRTAPSIKSRVIAFDHNNTYMLQFLPDYKAFRNAVALVIPLHYHTPHFHVHVVLRIYYESANKTPLGSKGNLCSVNSKPSKTCKIAYAEKLTTNTAAASVSRFKNSNTYINSGTHD